MPFLNSLFKLSYDFLSLTEEIISILNVSSHNPIAALYKNREGLVY